jgi:hypothetical protein
MLAPMFDALARLCRRRAGAVVLTWTALVAAGLATAVGGLGGHTVFDRLTSGALVVPGEAQDGLDLLLRAADDGPVVQLVLDDVDPHTYLAGTQLRYDAPGGRPRRRQRPRRPARDARRHPRRGRVRRPAGRLRHA